VRRRSALAGSVLACLVALPAALGGSAADPGVEPGWIRLGTTAPLTGESADDAAVARGANAYFAHMNAKGGVAGRRIEYVIADDAGDPAQALEATRALVEEDDVFAIVSPAGTEPTLAARRFLDSARVPQLFAASGAETLGRDRRAYPWSIGFQPSYLAEGAIYGRYVARTLGSAKVGVLHANDVAGRELLRGLRRGLSGSRARVVAAVPFGVLASIQPEVARLRASGASVLAIFATPVRAAQAFASLRPIGWRPQVVVNADSTPARGVPGGAVSFTFLKGPSDPQWARDPGMRLYRSLLGRYARGADARDVRYLHGMAVAYETIALLERAGAAPTRTRLMALARSIASAGNPFLLPGVAVRTSRTDGFPVQQGRLQRFGKGRWLPFGGLWSPR
jgi:branched-chain amino acid transport system substrate-binding protein